MHKKLKNREAPGPKGIYNEQIKYGEKTLNMWIKKLFNTIIRTWKILMNWKNSLLLSLFKRRYRNTPDLQEY